MTNVLIEATEDLAVDFRENPARTFANMAGMLEDEVSVVATDEDAGTVVLRIGDSGELVTVDLSGTENWLRDQIQGGVSFDGEADESGGVLRITTSDGDATIEVRGDGDGAFLRVSSSGNEMRLGAGDATAALPDWVPVYPGAHVQERLFSAETRDGSFGAALLRTDASPQEVVNWYRDAVHRAKGMRSSSVVRYDRKGVPGRFAGTYGDLKDRGVSVVVGEDDHGDSFIMIVYQRDD